MSLKCEGNATIEMGVHELVYCQLHPQDGIHCKGSSAFKALVH